MRIVHHYDGRPEFVLLGGLVPALLTAHSGARHAGTTDVDVQVNLEISSGAINAGRLEQALRNAEFEPDTQNIWRWKSASGSATVIKFELLADLPGGFVAECDVLLFGEEIEARPERVARLPRGVSGSGEQRDSDKDGKASTRSQPAPLRVLHISFHTHP